MVDHRLLAVERRLLALSIRHPQMVDRRHPVVDRRRPDPPKIHVGSLRHFPLFEDRSLALLRRYLASSSVDRIVFAAPLILILSLSSKYHPEPLEQLPSDIYQLRSCLLLFC
jgi:hypothetical protein